MQARCAMAAEAVDILQIPAFLCRQTDLLLAAAKTGDLEALEQLFTEDVVSYSDGGGVDGVVDGRGLVGSGTTGLGMREVVVGRWDVVAVGSGIDGAGATTVC